MATFSSVTRQHILQAIAEHDDRGAENFLGVYGFVPSGEGPLVHEGRSYDATAILGVAHRYATGRAATAEEFGGGRLGAADILRKRGFDVAGPGGATKGAAPRRAAAPRKAAAPRRPVVPEREVALCPTCFMTLPATGVCDSCA